MRPGRCSAAKPRFAGLTYGERSASHDTDGFDQQPHGASIPVGFLQRLSPVLGDDIGSVAGLHPETDDGLGWRGHNCSLDRLQSSEGSFELFQPFRGRLVCPALSASQLAASVARGARISRTSVAAMSPLSVSILVGVRPQQDREFAREDFELPLQSQQCIIASPGFGRRRHRDFGIVTRF